MSQQPPKSSTSHPLLRLLVRKNVLAGMMFIGIAALGLWLSRDYPLGTLRRMGTGYMPQLLCWLLMALGGIVLMQGLVERVRSHEPVGDDGVSAQPPERDSLRPIAAVAASLVAFALTIESLGLVVAIVALVAIASLAYPGLRWWETATTAVVLAALSWAVFVAGLGMTVKVLPELSSVIPDQRGAAERRSGIQHRECAKRAVLSATHAPCAGSRVSLPRLACSARASHLAGVTSHGMTDGGVG